MWFVHANLPIGRSTSVRTVDLHWGEWLNSSSDFNLITITSMQLLNKQASRPLHVHTTMQPPSKITVLISIPICEIKIKKSGIGHQIFELTSVKGGVRLEYKGVEAEEKEAEGCEGLRGRIAAVLLTGAVVHHHLQPIVSNILYCMYCNYTIRHQSCF